MLVILNIFKLDSIVKKHYFCNDEFIVVSWVLLIKNQITNLIPNLFYNICFKSLNEKWKMETYYI
jgi:hypothetical protein